MPVRVFESSHAANIILSILASINAIEVVLSVLSNHIILAIVWSAYCLLHSLLAASIVKKKLLVYLGKGYRYYRPFYTVFAFVFLAMVIYYQVHLPTVAVLTKSTVLVMAGILVGGFGIVLMVLCIKKYFASLSGFSGLFRETPAAGLMITGVHRYVRHPLYLGTFAFIWGLFLIFPHLSLLLSNVIITAYTLIGIRLEEKKLVQEYGQAYTAYQNEVPMLLPKI